MEKLIYIGSGLDIEPIVHFSKVKEFVFVDTLPRSGFDGYIHNESLFFDGFYRHKFIDMLVANTNKYGFQLMNKILLGLEYHTQILTDEQKEIWGDNFLLKFPDINPCLMIFVNHKTSQTIKYYISTNILVNMCEELKKDITETTGIIISGHHPSKIILNYITSPIKLYCYSNTCYYLEDDEVDNLNNLIYWLFNNPEKVKNYFNKIYICNRNSGNLFECCDMFQVDKIVKEIRN